MSNDWEMKMQPGGGPSLWVRERINVGSFDERDDYRTYTMKDLIAAGCVPGSVAIALARVLEPPAGTTREQQMAAAEVLLRVTCGWEPMKR